MNSDNKPFTKITEENIKNNINTLLQQGDINSIGNNLCFVNNNMIILNYPYFKYFAHKETYNFILNYIISIIDNLLIKNESAILHVNMQSITLSDIDKHKTFIKNISNLFKNRYPNKLNRCYIHNTPNMFEQIYKILKLFIDQETIDKIIIVK